jgi:hypothetical protein
METDRYAGQWNRLGLPRGSGESRAKRSTTGPAGPWTLLAREAEGLLVVLRHLIAEPARFSTRHCR